MDRLHKRPRLLHPKEPPPGPFQVQATLGPSQIQTSAVRRPLAPREDELPRQVQRQVKDSRNNPSEIIRWPRKPPKSEDEWGQIKELVREHHIDGDKTLKEVQERIGYELGFDVT